MAGYGSFATFTDRGGSVKAPGTFGEDTTGQPWWPKNESGAAYPTSNAYAQAIGNPLDFDASMAKAAKAKTAYDPNYGMVPESELDRIYGPAVDQAVQTGAAGDAARYADAGYGINPAGMTELSSRRRGELAGKVADVKSTNMAAGARNRAGFYDTNITNLLQGENAFAASIAQGYGNLLRSGIQGNQRAAGSGGTDVNYSRQTGGNPYATNQPTRASASDPGDAPDPGQSGQGQLYDRLYDPDTGVGIVTPAEQAEMQRRWQAGGYASGE